MRNSHINVNLRALQAFVAVYEAKSMTAAARNLCVSQSAISQLIASLERDRGVTLFERGCRPLRPSCEGHVLFGQAQQLLAHATLVSEKVRAVATEISGRIRIGCDDDSFAATIGPLLAQCLESRAIELSFLTASRDALVNRLRNEEIDMAISASNLADAPSRLLQIFCEPFVALVPKHLGLSATEFYAAPLSDLALLRYSRESTIGQHVDRLVSELHLPATTCYEFFSTGPIVELVGAGHGYAISTPLSLWQFKDHLGKIDVLSVPASRYSQRTFNMVSRYSDCSVPLDAVAAEILSVIHRTVRPDLQKTFSFEAQAIF